MGDAAYWDNWAGAIGPAPPTSPLPSGRGAGGEGRQQRRSSHSRLHPKANGRGEGPSRTSVSRFRGLRAATRGLIAAPWTPASLSLLRERSGQVALAVCE